MDFTFFDACGLTYVYSVINIKAIWDKLKSKTDDYRAVQTVNLQRGPICFARTMARLSENNRHKVYWIFPWGREAAVAFFEVYYDAPSIEPKVGLRTNLQFVPRMAMPVWFASRLNDTIIIITITVVFLNRKAKRFEHRQCVHPITMLINLLFNFYGIASLKACHCGTRDASLKNALDRWHICYASYT